MMPDGQELVLTIPEGSPPPQLDRVDDSPRQPRGRYFSPIVQFAWGSALGFTGHYHADQPDCFHAGTPSPLEEIPQ
jgi:hypothetical protein